MRAPITVIIVAFNHAGYVRGCLDSTLRQDLLPERVLVIDDCSQDGTAEEVAAYIADLPQDSPTVELRAHPENIGLCRSLNEALDSISTEFMAYISADDVMEPARFQRQFALIAQAGTDCAAVYSDALRIDEEGRPLPELFSDVHQWRSRACRSGDVYLELLADGNWIPAPSLLLRTAAVREAGGYDPELFYEDFDLLLRLARHHSIDVIDAPLVSFREVSASLGHTEFSFTNPRFLRAMVRIYQKNLGVTMTSDAVAVSRLKYWILRLWFAGAAASEVLPLLQSLDRAVAGWSTSIWIGLVRSRLPGRSMYRLASVTQRASSRARRVLRSPTRDSVG